MVSDRQPAVSGSIIMKCGDQHMTDNLDRARHFVRAVLFATHAPAVMRLTALPALLAPVAAGRFCPIVCQRLNPKIFFILYNSSLNVCRRAGLRQFTLKSEWDGRTAKHRRSQGFPI
jgi:hypothetical protein